MTDFLNGLFAAPQTHDSLYGVSAGHSSSALLDHQTYGGAPIGLTENSLFGSIQNIDYQAYGSHYQSIIANFDKISGKSDTVMESIPTTTKGDVQSSLNTLQSISATADIIPGTEVDQNTTAALASPVALFLAPSQITPSDFSWPDFGQQQSPAFPNFDDAVKYIYSNILQRDPSSAEITHYSSVIAANYLYTVNYVNYYNYDPAFSDVAQSEESTNKIQAAFQATLGAPASSDLIKTAEDDESSGVPYTSLVNALATSSMTTQSINTIFQDELGRAASSTDIANEANALQNGETLSQIQHDVAYSPESVSQISTIFSTVDGVIADQNQISNYQGSLATGSSLGQIRQWEAYGSNAQTQINGIFQDVDGTSPSFSDLGRYQAYLAGNGGNLAQIRQWEAYGSNAQTQINDIFQDVDGTTPSSSDLGHYQAYLAGNGGNLAQIRQWEAYGSNAQTQINDIFQDVDGTTPSSSDLGHYQAYLAGNGGNLAQIRQWEAYGSNAQSVIDRTYQFLYGRTPQSDELGQRQSDLVNGASQNQITLNLTGTSEAFAEYQNIYADWGQVPPTDDQLKMAGQAMYNLHSAWITTIENQSTDQLSAEAAAYNSPASSSFQDMVFDLASSAIQAVGLEANLLVNTYLETTADSGDARNLLVAGGENAMAAAFDEGSVLTALKKIKKEDDKDCDPVAFRKNEAIVKNISNDTVKSANQTFGNFNGTDWNQSYKDQGIQWKTATSGTNTNQQGLPYEAWVQNQLNPSQDPNGVIWLQPLKANWKVFDHWDDKNSIATSDKTINLAAPSYKSSPYAVAARVEASVDKMLGYITDGTKDETVRFDKEDIGSYVLNLAVPYIADPEAMDPQTAAEWKALCRAYHDVLAEMSAEGKIFTFNINAVS
ncbi:MAG: hypothetical protein ABF542_04280 [Gluconobacter sp.]